MMRFRSTSWISPADGRVGKASRLHQGQGEDEIASSVAPPTAELSPRNDCQDNRIAVEKIQSLRAKRSNLTATNYATRSTVGSSTRPDTTGVV